MKKVEKIFYIVGPSVRLSAVLEENQRGGIRKRRRRCSERWELNTRYGRWGR